jgi:hypothetical protein
MTTKQFYLICLIGITLVGGLVLLFLWRQIKLKSKENKSLLFIALAMFSWTIVGLYKYYDPPMPSLIHAINDRVLSAFSNLFLIASLPYFPEVFNRFKERFSFFRKPEQWVINMFIFFAIITAIFTMIDRNVENDSGKKMIIVIDSVISTITMSAISYAIYQSLTRFWQDKFLQRFLFVIFLVLISTQIVLPLIAIFPDQLKPYYLGALLLLLLGLIFFNLITIAYYSMLGYELHASNIARIQNGDLESTAEIKLLPEQITVGFNDSRKEYFVRIRFVSPDDTTISKEEEVVSTKILQPFANWVLFSLARKKEIKLSHVDLSTVKFRMVEFWNKESNTKLTQEQLFNNDRGMVDLKIALADVIILNPDFLKSKFIIRESIIKHAESFGSFLETEVKESLTKEKLHDLLVNRLFESI